MEDLKQFGRSPGGLASRRHTLAILCFCLLLPISIGAQASEPSGYVNHVLSFDAAGGYMTIPSAPRLQNALEITIEAWLYPVYNPAVSNPLFLTKTDGKNVSSARSYEMGWNRDIGLNVSLFAGESTWIYLTAAAPERKWVHVAVTFESSTGSAKLYTNGILAVSTLLDAGQITPLAGKQLRQTELPLVFGRMFPSEGTLAYGSMDEVRIWQVARSAAEIQRDMRSVLSGKEPYLAGYWNFDSKLGDLTGNAAVASLAGAASVTAMAGEDILHSGAVPHFTTSTLASREAKFFFSADPKTSVQIDYSSDLLHWLTLFVADQHAGVITVVDQADAFTSRRFYRAITK